MLRRLLFALLLGSAALPARAADYVLVVHPSVPAETLAKLRDLAGEQPLGLSFANAGDGSTTHRVARRFAEEAHLEVTHVPYAGNAKALAAVLAGEAAATFAGGKAVAAAVKRGKLRALAVTGPGRLASLPDVPTFAQAGLPGVRPD